MPHPKRPSGWYVRLIFLIFIAFAASRASPPLVFAQLLFGYRSLDELRGVYSDVWAEGEAGPLLDALFPKRPARLIPRD